VQARAALRRSSPAPIKSTRSLYLVEIGERVLLIGAGEGGAPSLLAELDPSELPPAPERPLGMLELMQKLRAPGPPKS